MRGILRRWMLLARIDARQPAAWLAAAVAALVAAWLPCPTPAGWPTPAVVATLLGAALAVMALGDAGNFRDLTSLDVGWLAERVAWPLLGWAAAAALRQNWLLLACGAVGMLASAMLVAALVRRGALGADAASTALVAAAGAVAAGWWAESSLSGRLPAGAVVAVLLLGVLGAAATMSPTLPVRLHVRRALTAAGMVGALAGMVAWLFLAADRAALDLAASLAWFAALAVPAATLGDGVSHADPWRRLERVAPGDGARRPRLGPGRTRDGVLAVLTTGALLGWPPLVAALLSGAQLAGAWPAVSVVVAVGAAAGALLAVVWLGERAGMSPASLQAAVIGCACLALVAAMATEVAGPNCR